MRPVSLKVRALQWLAQREHSPQELRAKLLRAARAAPAGARPDASSAVDESAAAAEVDALIAWLDARGHLSRQRFVESRIHAREKRWGNQRIEHELRRHGLAPDEAAQQALRDSELSRAREVWRRKYGVPPGDAAARIRQMRFLVGRGFSPEVVRQVVRGAGNDAEPESLP